MRGSQTGQCGVQGAGRYLPPAPCKCAALPVESRHDSLGVGRLESNAIVAALISLKVADRRAACRPRLAPHLVSTVKQRCEHPSYRHFPAVVSSLPPPVSSRRRLLFAFVNERIGAHLRGTFPGIALCGSWNEVAAAVGTSEHSLVFFDPCVTPDALSIAMDFRKRFASTAFVVYSPLEPSAIHLSLKLASAGFRDVVLLGHLDDRRGLERLVEDVRTRSARPALPDAVLARLRHLPPKLGEAIKNVVRQPRRYRTAADLASAARMSPRAVARHMHAAGITSPKRLVAGARLACAYVLLCNEGKSLQQIANILGYYSPDQVSKHFDTFVGASASDVRKSMPQGDFLNAMEAVLIRGAIVATGPADGAR